MKNNEQNNSANESLEDKKSIHSITQYVALNSENLNNMIIHIDDLATKYDKTIKSFNDTLINIQTNNNELANRYDNTLQSLNGTLKDISNRYDNTLQSLNDTLKKSNQIQDKLIELLQKLVPA